MNKIESILGTTKDEGETWYAVFDRLNERGNIDLKTLAKLVCEILEILDAKK
jgi:hypothetical protein